MINNYDSFTIFGWMKNELKLEGPNLLVYAKLFTDGQDGGPIIVDYEYLTEFLGINEQRLKDTIKYLLKENLIEHREKYMDLRNCYILDQSIFRGKAWK